MLQGRLAEAEAVLTGFEDDWECATAAAALDLAQGRPTRAVAILGSALEHLRDAPVLAVPLLAQRVDAAIAADAVPLAAESARAIATVAASTGSALHRAQAGAAEGKVALARGAPEAATMLRAASVGFAQTGASNAWTAARASVIASPRSTTTNARASASRARAAGSGALARRSCGSSATGGGRGRATWAP